MEAAINQAEPALSTAARTAQRPNQFGGTKAAIDQAAAELSGGGGLPNSSDAGAVADAVHQLQADFAKPTVNVSQASEDIGNYKAVANRFTQDLGGA